MRPIVITQTGAGQSAAVPLDRYIAPFRVSAVTVVTAPATYGLQYTYDDVFNPPSGGITWIDSTEAPALTTTTKENFFEFPISALRINQSAGAGSVTLTVNQAGIV